MFGNVDNYFENLANRVKLREGAEGIWKSVQTIYRYSETKISNKKLTAIIGIPVPVVSAIRNELVKDEFLTSKKLLTDDAKEWLEKEVGFKFKIDFFQNIEKSIFSGIDKSYIDYFSTAIDYLNNRPDPDYTLDQSRSTNETVMKRVLKMLYDGSIEGRKIVILGDDDGVSVLLAHLNCSERIQVLELDDRIISYLTGTKSIFKNIDNFSVNKVDLRKKLPEKFLYSFNVFETDPPYTVNGFTTFINEAISLLDKTKKSFGYISFGRKSPLDTWKTQDFLIQSGFIIKEHYQNFNLYKGATILGNTSDFYSVESIPHKIRYINNLSRTSEEFYTFEARKSLNVPTVGFQIIAELYDVPEEWLNNASMLKNLIIEAINCSELTMQEIFTKEYQPHGLSVIAILVESHCHVHTWPEYKYLSLDIFVCEKAEKAKNLLDYLINKMNPVDYSKISFYRGGKSKLNWS